VQLVGYKVAMFLVHPNINHCIDINSGVDIYIYIYIYFFLGRQGRIITLAASSRSHELEESKSIEFYIISFSKLNVVECRIFFFKFRITILREFCRPVLPHPSFPLNTPLHIIPV